MSFYIFPIDCFDFLPQHFLRRVVDGYVSKRNKIKRKFSECLLTVLLTRCTQNTVHHFCNSPLKMAYHTPILNHQTHRSLDANNKNSPNSNFEYEEFIKRSPPGLRNFAVPQVLLGKAKRAPLTYGTPVYCVI